MGEIAESLEALRVFNDNPTEQNALDALVEFGDVFYNMLKLSQDSRLGLDLRTILVGIMDDFPQQDNERLAELYFELCNIAIWKFWFRYIQSEGIKNPDAEAIELEKKWLDTTQNGSPVAFLEEKADDCRLLLRGVARFSRRLLFGVMRDLDLNKAQEEEIISYLIDSDSI